ncbi:MAG: GNAT family N-acetyltransferase [Chloroflexia bacterium]|nr:GNAT family N-acetyltransferase [Chloroflexia bacterium]
MSGPVTIRRATADDAELIFAWRNEPAAQRYQPLRTLSLARVRQNLSDRAALELGPHVSGELQWIIVAAARPVGWITLRVHNREHGVGELGYTVGSAYHRRGVASAAVQLILPVAFGATTGTNLGGWKHGPPLTMGLPERCSKAPAFVWKASPGPRRSSVACAWTMLAMGSCGPIGT